MNTGPYQLIFQTIIIKLEFQSRCYFSSHCCECRCASEITAERSNNDRIAMMCIESIDWTWLRMCTHMSCVGLFFRFNNPAMTTIILKHTKWWIKQQRSNNRACKTEFTAMIIHLCRTHHTHSIIFSLSLAYLLRSIDLNYRDTTHCGPPNQIPQLHLEFFACAPFMHHSLQICNYKMNFAVMAFIF